MLISLTKFNIKRPEKLSYDFIFPHGVDAVNQIKSKSLKSFLLKTDEILRKNNIEYVCEDVTEEKFYEWLPYYTSKMEEHGYDVRAKREWYQEQINKGIHIKGLFFYQNQKLIGSLIFSLQNNVAVGAYKASDRVSIDSHKTSSSLGSIVEFLFLKVASENGCELATGRSRNAFGFFNTLGYLEYKLRFGYNIRPSLNIPLLDSVPVNETGRVLFFGIQDEKFILFSLQPESEKGIEWFDKKRFVKSGIIVQELYY